MSLPLQGNLPVHHLAACFNNTSATYKFYWFLSILQSIENGETQIPKRHLFARMISNAWYTINYFHISFGKQDKLQRAVEFLKEAEGINIDEQQDIIFERLSATTRADSLKHLNYFNNQVPHWFLSPWFPGKGKQDIYSDSKAYNGQCLYALDVNEIKINPAWELYLFQNIRLLKDFCYWNLATFLQSKNPNVPDIPNKLIRPAIRSSLIRQRKQFWDIVITKLGSIECIYTGKELEVGNYAVEHFIPYSFVSHDLVWNLIPADASFNSSKRDKLPPFEKYFDPFSSLQKRALQIVQEVNPKNKLLEDYLTIFPDLKEVSSLSNEAFNNRFRDQMSPLVTIASNNGFEFMS